VDEVATSFVALAAEAGCFHPSWLLLTRPCLSGVRQPTPASLALQQSFLMMQSTQWAQATLTPFFARMMSAKMKRKRTMKVRKAKSVCRSCSSDVVRLQDADLLESFDIAIDLVTSDETIAALPRGIRALAGLLWKEGPGLGMSRESQVEVVAEFYFKRLLHPLLLVPDQYGLVEPDKLLAPLARSVLPGLLRCMHACVYSPELAASPLAFMGAAVKAARVKIARFVEKLATDPTSKGWSDFADFAPVIDVDMARGDAGLGVWLNLLLRLGPGAQSPELRALVRELEVVGSELERRRAIEGVVNEEKDFTLRMDGVTFWLRDLELGLVVESTALRMANEWLKKVNQLRAVLRISLNKRTHFTQWNGRISDLVDAADFVVFAEYAKVLRNSLPIVANSLNQQLERAILAYKQETSRDPLRDLVAVAVHGKTLLTRLSRLPPALEADEREKLAAAVGRAQSLQDDAICQECSEIVRLHQMQSSIVTGWACFPRELAEQSGLVRPGRKQIMYGKVVPLHPTSIKSAKYAMLLSDMLLLLEAVSDKFVEGASSAREREEYFGGGSGFQQSLGPSSGKGVRKKAQAKKLLKGIDVCFRLVACVPLADARLRLKPAQNAFVVANATGAVIAELGVAAAQKMEWITAWAKIECMEHSQKADNSGLLSARGDNEGAVPSPRSRSTEGSPKGSPSASPRPNSEEDDIDEMEALMALGMYDTAVVRKPDSETTDVDTSFLEMVDGLKRRDGKSRIPLQELFEPPPGLRVKLWQASLRHMKPGVFSDDEEGEAEPAPAAESAATKKEEESEEMQLRMMLANCQVTLRYVRNEL
jgi:hypothetical protein